MYVGEFKLVGKKYICLTGAILLLFEPVESWLPPGPQTGLKPLNSKYGKRANVS